MRRRWNATVVLEHVPGGGATVGIGRVADGPTDGSQLLILSRPYVTSQFLMARLPYEPERDIVPLVQLTRQPNLLCVRKDLPVATIAELIGHAKANPGKLTYASAGSGTPAHLAAELFQKMTGTQLIHVPYAGSAPAQNDLVGGHVDIMIDNAASIVGQVRSGSVKALGITTPNRYALAPEFPPVSDTVPGFASGGWFGIAVKAGTPVEVQDKLIAAGLDLLKQQATIERLVTLLSEPVGAGKEEFGHFLAEERHRWGSLIADLKLKN
jgi:tripartite-type tricarboxylate transporter receptor subunit TctC